MQVFGVCQLSELKGWRRGSPDNQAAIRRAAVGSWRHRWQKNAVSLSRRPHRLRSKRSPTCRSRSRRSRSTVATSSRTNSSKLVRPRGNPPVRTAAQPAADQGALERRYGSMRYESYACYELPRSVEALNPILKKHAASLRPVQTTRCPCRTNSGQLPQRTLSQRDPASHAYLSRTRD